jgi:hypothetical protein
VISLLTIPITTTIHYLVTYFLKFDKPRKMYIYSIIINYLYSNNRKRYFYHTYPISDEFEDERYKITLKNWIAIISGLGFSGFLMYSIIVIEANITEEVRYDWLTSYSIGFITSQVITPLLKALVSCFMVISLIKVDFDSCSAKFMKKVLGNDFVNWYNL